MVEKSRFLSPPLPYSGSKPLASTLTPSSDPKDLGGGGGVIPGGTDGETFDRVRRRDLTSSSVGLFYATVGDSCTSQARSVSPVRFPPPSSRTPDRPGPSSGRLPHRVSTVHRLRPTTEASESGPADGGTRWAGLETVYTVEGASGRPRGPDTGRRGGETGGFGKPGSKLVVGPRTRGRLWAGRGTVRGSGVRWSGRGGYRGRT